MRSLRVSPAAQQDGVVRQLQPLQVEVVLGEGHEVEADVVQLADQPRAVAQRVLVEVRVLAGEALFVLRNRGPGTGQQKRPQPDLVGHPASSSRGRRPGAGDDKNSDQSFG